jgi:hypothetical protein
MNDVLRQLAAGQAGCVATWQLRGAGLSMNAIRHRPRDLRRIHDGVFLTGDALAFASAGAAYEMRPWKSTFEVIVRRGSGGSQRQQSLLICRTKDLHQTTLDGLPITTPERTLADLWPRVPTRPACCATRCASSC